jgi:hypothetical protein
MLKVFENPRNGALAHAGKSGRGNVPGAVVDEVLVDLVGEQEQIVSAAGLGNGLDF